MLYAIDMATAKATYLVIVELQQDYSTALIAYRGPDRSVADRIADRERRRGRVAHVTRVLRGGVKS